MILRMDPSQDGFWPLFQREERLLVSPRLTWYETLDIGVSPNEPTASDTLDDYNAKPCHAVGGLK